MKKTFIFKYTTKDGKWLGYHYDTFCTTGNSCLQAKRYLMIEESVPEQLEVIQNNFNYLCDKKTEGKFHDYPKEDIIISYEELAESIVQQAPHGYKYQEII